MNYINLAYAIKVHEMILEISEGKAGVLNIDLLESTLNLVRNDDYYPTFIDKLTYLVFSISKNHAFVDANKRSSILIGAYFILINIEDSKYYVIGKFIREMENIVLNVVQNRIHKSLLSQIIESILTEDDFSEELKLKLIQSIS